MSTPTSPFHFYTRLNLLELTGMKARNLEELLEGIRAVPGSVIYHHTHRYLLQHRYLSPEPPNDFAFWVQEVLGEEVIAEELSAIDICLFTTIKDLKKRIIEILDKHVTNGNHGRVAPPGQEFHFIRSISFIIPTHYRAHSLRGFVRALKRISVDSIYYHIFEARLRLHKVENHFSQWFRDSLNEDTLADKVARLDPYTQTLEDLRKRIIGLAEARIQEIEHAGKNK